MTIKRSYHRREDRLCRAAEEVTDERKGYYQRGCRRRRPMTEAEWLAATDPRVVLESWSWPTSERKMRLFCCACCRRIWPLITAPESRKAVEVSESLADGRTREG